MMELTEVGLGQGLMYASTILITFNDLIDLSEGTIFGLLDERARVCSVLDR